MQKVTEERDLFVLIDKAFGTLLVLFIKHYSFIKTKINRSDLCLKWATNMLSWNTRRMNGIFFSFKNAFTMECFYICRIMPGSVKLFDIRE